MFKMRVHCSIVAYGSWLGSTLSVVRNRKIGLNLPPPPPLDVARVIESGVLLCHMLIRVSI